MKSQKQRIDEWAKAIEEDMKNPGFRRAVKAFIRKTTS
jgi:hypothetical protein